MPPKYTRIRQDPLNYDAVPKAVNSDEVHIITATTRSNKLKITYQGG